MTDHLLSATIAQLVCDDSRRATVFSTHRIDYSYAGGRLLSSVLAQPGFDSRQVLADLSELTDRSELRERAIDDEPDWTEASIDDLIDHIVSEHHETMRRVLSDLTSQMAKVIRLRGRDHPELETLGEVFTDFSSELQRHMEKEERILFPIARKIARGALTDPSERDVANRLRVIRVEHDVAGRTLQAMRQLSQDYRLAHDTCVECRILFDGFQAIEQDMQVHVHKENNILFSMLEERAALLPE